MTGPFRRIENIRVNVQGIEAGTSQAYIFHADDGDAGEPGYKSAVDKLAEFIVQMMDKPTEDDI